MRLSIDLSTRIGSLALHKVQKGQPVSLIGLQSLEGDHRHSELLLTYLKNFLATHEVKTESLKELVTSLGPGSFTGLRIALSTMKAFSMAWQLPLFMVNASEARARAFKKRNLSNQSNILVLTKVASKLYSQAFLPNSGIFKEGDTSELSHLSINPSHVVLADSIETKNALGNISTLFPVEAEYLGEQLEDSQSRIDCKTFEELVNASPIYYGSSRF